ncbi:MAG: class I SAM-dependent methyltransferase [Candidatus Thorarchaeota archaeon]|nr:class I SAM-dependent methyltransferase [Candidatus Thorarchaeota archaeon]
MDEISSFITPLQEIMLENISRKGAVLDIGGGGEALVSRLERQRVCAADIRLDKIKEGQIYDALSQWILTDACGLCFQDACFEVATFWFSLGYLGSFDLKQSAAMEAHRCLKPGGLLSIIAAKIVNNEERYVFNSRFIFPDKSVSQIKYAVKGKQNQSLESISQLVKDLGFQIIYSEEHEHWFRIDATKH